MHKFGLMIELHKYKNPKETYNDCYVCGLTTGYTQAEYRADYLACCCDNEDVFVTEDKYYAWLHKEWIGRKIQHMSYRSRVEIHKDNLLDVVFHSFQEKGVIDIVCPKDITYLGGKPYLIFEFETKLEGGNSIMNAFHPYTYSDHITHEKMYASRGACVYKQEGGVFTEMSGACDHNWKWVSDYLPVNGGVARARLCSLCDKEEVKLLEIN